MKRLFSIFCVAVVLVGFTGCGVRKAANLTNCDFSFDKITGVTWAGINFMKTGFDYKKLDAGTLANCASALVKKDFALHVDMNLKGVNPTKSPAGLAGFDYILYYKGNKVGEGESTNVTDIDIPSGGGSATIPVNFSVNFKDLVDMKHPLKSAENAVGFISDVAKLGKSNSNFTVKLRPHVRMGNRVMKTAFLNIGGKD